LSATIGQSQDRSVQKVPKLPTDAIKTSCRAFRNGLSPCILLAGRVLIYVSPMPSSTILQSTNYLVINSNGWRYFDF
jgi:hypothetical protein